MANRILADLFGTALSKFQIGIDSAAMLLKSASSKLRVRNKADSADAELVASQLSASGDTLLLNEDAAGSGADWTMKFSRPASGMTEAREIIFPSGNPSPGQVMEVASYAAGVVTLDYLTVAAGNDKIVTDTTSLAFGSSSPVAMFTLPANAVIWRVLIDVDTVFNGTTPTVSIGVSGTTSKFMGATQSDLATGGSYEVDASLVATSGSTQALIATYSAGGSSAGAARIIVDYSIPS
jgi:hypothetical protein